MDRNIQLKMTFEQAPNQFRNNMENGVFMILFEVDTPPKHEDISAAGLYLKSMEQAVLQAKGAECGLAITDKKRAAESWNPADFANDLDPAHKNRHVVFISGRHAYLKDVADSAERCRSSGFANVAAVTGDGGMQPPPREKKRLHHTDSIHILNQLQSRGDGFFFAGAAANPFKYTPASIFPQYCKIMKKIRRGTSFLICQSGWDMIKLQELRWYLEMREQHISLLSRITLLTPESADDIGKGRRPGVFISNDLAHILRKESQYGLSQFTAAQWRRIQIQAAGARLLGYSGVVVEGLERPEHVQTVCSKVADSFAEMKTFDDWKEAYLEYLSRADMAPYPDRFYIFKNLFTRQHPEVKIMAPTGSIRVSGLEKLNHALCRIIFSRSNMRYADELYLTKKILVGCPGCSCCRLPLMHHICPETCPKGLSNGPCGGSKTDGKCECSPRECIHSKHFRLASHLKELDTLEDRYIRPVEDI